MLAKIGKFVKENKTELILFLTVVLISLLSFSWGYITAKKEEKKTIIIDYQNEKHPLPHSSHS
jgi:predicted negative regulator of RcsB-dependent stress response